MSEELLNIRGVSKHFGGVKAVDNLSFHVPHGVIKAIIGPNGAGKTTLFNLISGNLRPTTGRIELNGRDVTRVPDHRKVYQGVTRTFQTTRVFYNMSVLENVMLGRHPRSRSGFLSAAFRMPWMLREEHAIRKAAMNSLEFVGLTELADHPSDTLSFMQQRLLEFARALATEPQLLLADEPAAGLNSRETKDVAALVRRINHHGITVLIVEHDMSLVMDISDEILVLNYGSKIAEGPPSEIRLNKDVIDVYLGRRSDHA